MSVYDHENDPRIFGGDNDPRLDADRRTADAIIDHLNRTEPGATGMGGDRSASARGASVEYDWLGEWAGWGIAQLENMLVSHAAFSTWLVENGRA